MDSSVVLMASSRVTFRRSGGKLPTQIKHCTVADGVAEKHVLATYINAYLKNQYPFNCTLNVGFFH